MSDDSKRIAKEIRRASNRAHNNCGCLVLILLSPIWIPILLWLIGKYG